MKKLLLLTTFLFASLLIKGQTLLWTDSMNYPLGPVHEGRWGSWSGNPGSEDLVMVDNGPWQMDSHVGYIGNPGQDAMFKLGNLTSGVYRLYWFMHIPENKTAYFNIQEDENPLGTGSFTVVVYFNEAGNTPGLGTIKDENGNFLANFDYGTSGILYVAFEVNLDADTFKFWNIDGSGTVAYEGPFYSNGGNLGGVDFYRLNDNTEYFVDQFQFWEMVLSTDDFSKDTFSMYPNPVKDKLNIKSKAIVDHINIYNLLGQEIMSLKPNIISPIINTSNLATGTYLVEVTIGGNTKTFKIIK